MTKNKTTDMNEHIRFLFITWEGGGNVPPVLGIVDRLVKRGHQVSVLAEPCLRSQIETIGADYIPFKAYFTRTDRRVDLIQDAHAKPLSIPSIDNILLAPAISVAQETLSAIAKTQAQIVVADFMMPGALFAAEKSGVKRVALFHMPEYFPGDNRPPGGFGLLPAKNRIERFRDRLLKKLFYRVLGQYLGRYNEARAALDLPPHQSLVDVYHQADLRLIQTCEAFDAPLDPAPANVRYTGAVLDDPHWTEPCDLSFLENSTKPKVLVSLSSTFQDQKSLLDRIIQALSRLEVDALVTTGPSMADASFASHDNIKIVASAPHTQVLPLVDLVITHAGHGTVIRSLSFGKPLVCLPMGRDQIDNAALVQYRGAGLKLSKSSKASKIKEACERILSEQHFREHAEGLAEHILEDSREDRAVSYLETMLCN